MLIPLVKLIFSFLLSYPLAGVLKRLPDNKPWQKNVFIIRYVSLYAASYSMAYRLPLQCLDLLPRWSV